MFVTFAAKGQLPVELDPHTLAQQALEANDPSGCLAQLEQLSEKQRDTQRNQWLRVRCLHASWQAKPKDERVAAACMVAGERYVSGFSGDIKYKENTDITRTWLNGLRKHFDHNGLQFKSLRHADLPTDQQVVLAEVEKLLERYSLEQNYSEIELDLQNQLDRLAELDLPMPMGDSPFIYCLRHDAIDPFNTLMTRIDPIGREVRINQLMTSAVAFDAFQITSKLLNEHFGKRDLGMENGLMEVATERHANRVLQQWFNARSSDKIPGLNTWETIAPRHATALAQAAVSVEDTTFLREVLKYGVDPDSLGKMVFGAIEGMEPTILDILLDNDPPAEARDEAGLSYLHKAMALDSPEALKVLYEHDWFKTLAGEVDPEGLPAVHYLVMRDLPNILAEPGILSPLEMNATDLQGFTLLHKLIFRPDSMSMPTADLLRILLKYSPKMKRDTTGPYYNWTALHYAARQDRPDLVAILVKDKTNKADRYAQDKWKRTPRDVAKERGYKKVLSAL